MSAPKDLNQMLCAYLLEDFCTTLVATHSVDNHHGLNIRDTSNDTTERQESTNMLTLDFTNGKGPLLIGAGLKVEVVAARECDGEATLRSHGACRKLLATGILHLLNVEHDDIERVRLFRDLG